MVLSPGGERSDVINGKRRKNLSHEMELLTGTARQPDEEADGATARVLVLGAGQVGKSAAIVRFTTGRFIHEYCHSTQEWLYQHHLMASSTSPEATVELMEQRDFQLDDDTNELRLLSSRLQWANAFVIVYSLTSAETLDKASEYLKLLGLASTGCTGESNHLDQENLAPESQDDNHTHHSKPILLLGNKLDLATPEAPVRRAKLSDGRQLAARHRCLFAELSISRCPQAIVSQMLKLVELVREQRQQKLLQELKLRQQRQYPIWSSLVRTSLPLVDSSCSSSQWIGSQQQPQTQGISMVSQGQCPFGSQQQPALTSYRPLFYPKLSSTSSSFAVAGAKVQCAPQPLTAASSSNNKQSATGGASGGRYGQFKSTFKRASLAIVGGRALASKATAGAGVTATNAREPSEQMASLKRNSTASSGLSELSLENQHQLRQLESSQMRGSNGSLGSASLSSQHSAGTQRWPHLGAKENSTSTSKLNKPSNWIKSRFSSGSGGPNSMSTRQETENSSESELVRQSSEQPQQQQHLVQGNRFKRPLFKYRNRLKTVAFEPNFSKATAAAATKPQQLHSSDSIQTITTTMSTNHSQQDQSADEIPPSLPAAASALPASASSSSCYSTTSAHNPTRCSSGRSSSSLSTSDTYYSSLFIAAGQVDQAPCSQVAMRSPLSSTCSTTDGRCDQRSLSTVGGGGRACRRVDSRSTLSRASTSGGSYDEADEDQVALYENLACTTTTIVSRAPSNSIISLPPPPPPSLPLVDPGDNSKLARKPPAGNNQQMAPAVIAPAKQQMPVKSRFQVVKTVQSTLTNLAKSTSAKVNSPQASLSTATSPAQAVKRSFCQALMSSSIGFVSPKACETVTKQQTPAVQVAKIEAIETIPTVVGYCK